MSSIESVGRAILSLALVVGLMWLLARWARGRGRKGARSREGVEVLARQALTRNSAITVVRIADRAMVLGVTDTHVSLLGDVEADAFDRVAPRVVDAATAVPPALVPSAQGLPVPVSPVPLSPVPAVAAATVAGPEVRRVRRGGGRLDGSALSPATWTQTLDFLRERTVRR